MNLEIGKKIAAYRQRHHLTIRELAEETGLSSALLSQLERGMGNPTLYALKALAHTLGIPLSRLVEQPIPYESLILRKKDRRKIYSASGQPLYDVLSSSATRSPLELFYLELPPHEKTQGGLSSHPEEEILLLLAGSGLCYLENEVFHLAEGDSVRILPNMGHQLENNTDAPLKVLYALCHNG